MVNENRKCLAAEASTPNVNLMVYKPDRVLSLTHDGCGDFTSPMKS
jgi:hypothetical protein